ncbi:hypothetical protein O181_052089 [Austropuccinia psidii MF-1]|uniref:Uncharacterized protein n=1 Tax=Austropuccinia psidii MF-1 TaxID=1389203 RepID=A0A9Q3DZZ9_9BASI|nr:hypothetical protein [Austropuccinia psidii MF-1]
MRAEGKGSHQDKKPAATASNSSRPPKDLSSKKPHNKKIKKGKNLNVSNDQPHSALLNKDNKCQLVTQNQSTSMTAKYHKPMVGQNTTQNMELSQTSSKGIKGKRKLTCF